MNSFFNCHLRASNRGKRDPDADVDDEACAEERKGKEDSELKNTSVVKCRERQKRDLFPKAHISAKKKLAKTGIFNYTNQGSIPFRSKRVQMLLTPAH